MESHKKERSSRQHMKIDLSRERENHEQNGGLLLANPMCSDNFSPGTPTGQITRTSTERGSFKKTRPKSPSLLRFFVRSGSRKVSSADEDEYGSSGSDHEDPFSPRDKFHSHDMVHANKHTDYSSRSGSMEPNAARYHKPSKRSNRDSGFASERGSVSQRDERDSFSHNTEDSAFWEDYRPGGMAALEMLHDQLQILVKSDGIEMTDGVSGQEAVIAGLQEQLEATQQSLDCLRQSDTGLRVSLQQERQRVVEAEAKLSIADTRYHCLEQRYVYLAYQYQALTRKHHELEKIQQRAAVLQQMDRVTSTPTLPPQVQTESQHEVVPKHSDTTPAVTNAKASSAVLKRPGSAQGLGYIETCV